MFRSSAAFLAPKLAPAAMMTALQKRGCEAFYGVPDSLLKDFCAYVTDNTDPTNHVITANEGNAVAMATGYHLASGKVPAVYMQNSGFGNAVNPLLSLTHREVYKIPMLLIVGWRGDPGAKADEPQHVAQGRLMDKCFECCEVPYEVLGAGESVERDMEAALDKAFAHIKQHGTPFGLLIKRDTFDTYKMKGPSGSKLTSRGGIGSLDNLPMSREGALETIIGQLPHDAIVVSTTGMPSREVFEIRARAKAGHHRDFLTVGCMGHCSSIAAGIALQRPDRMVYAIDGDGASIMHMGSYAVNGGLASAYNVAADPPRSLLDNLRHIVVNNGAHDSVGGQPTVGHDVSLSGVARECGYNVVCKEPVMDQNDLTQAMNLLSQPSLPGTGPAFLEVLVKKGNRKDLGRPTTTPIENKEALMKFIQE